MKNIYKTEIAIIRATMLKSPNPMFMSWTVDFYNERLAFKAPFRSKKREDSKLEYVEQFISYLSSFLNEKSANRSENEKVLAIYVKNFLCE